jgi:hypothetical protein
MGLADCRRGRISRGHVTLDYVQFIPTSSIDKIDALSIYCPFKNDAFAPRKTVVSQRLGRETQGPRPQAVRAADQTRIITSAQRTVDRSRST